MSTTVHLYSNLQRYTGDQITVDVDGSTVGQCLNNLMEKYPRIKPALFDKNGQLQSLVNLSINLQSVRSEPLNTPLKPGDQLYIILIAMGG